MLRKIGMGQAQNTGGQNLPRRRGVTRTCERTAALYGLSELGHAVLPRVASSQALSRGTQNVSLAILAPGNLA